MNTTELILKSGKIITRIPTDTIVKVTGVANYSQFWLCDGRRIISAYTLKVYQGLLPDYFLRIHKACLVNGNCIIGRVGQYKLLLTDGSRVEIARRKADTFRAQYAMLQNNQTEPVRIVS